MPRALVRTQAIRFPMWAAVVGLWTATMNGIKCSTYGLKPFRGADPTLTTRNNLSAVDLARPGVAPHSWVFAAPVPCCETRSLGTCFGSAGQPKLQSTSLLISGFLGRHLVASFVILLPFLQYVHWNRLISQPKMHVFAWYHLVPRISHDSCFTCV